MSRLATGRTVNCNSSHRAHHSSPGCLRKFCGVLAESLCSLCPLRISLVQNVKCHLTGPATNIIRVPIPVRVSPLRSDPAYYPILVDVSHPISGAELDHTIIEDPRPEWPDFHLPLDVRPESHENTLCPVMVAQHHSMIPQNAAHRTQLVLSVFCFFSCALR